MNKIIGGESFNFDQVRPDRRFYPTLLRKYKLVLGIIVVSVLFIEAAPYNFLWTVLCALAYLGYTGVLMLIKRLYPKWYRSQSLHFFRAFALIVGISAFLYFLYSQTSYLADHRSADTLWLLFLIANFIVILHGKPKNIKIATIVILMFMTFVAIASLEMVAVFKEAPDITSNLERFFFASLPILAKMLWLGLLAFILYVVVRYLADQVQDINLIRELEVSITKIHDEEEQLQRLVDSIAGSFHYPHVNIFKKQPDGSLCCIAGAGDHGRELASKGFKVEADVSMLMHAARTGKIYATNDVSKTVDNDHPNGFYLADLTEFPRTQAEMAIPIWVNNKVTAVLDIQAEARGYFVPNDVVVMQVLVGHVERSLTSMKAMEFSRRILHSYFASGPLDINVRYALEEALAEFEAHSIILFEHEPMQGWIKPLAFVGKIKNREMITASKTGQGSLLQRLVHNVDHYFHDDARAFERDSALFRPSSFHIDTGQPTFVEREGIASRAILCLQNSKDDDSEKECIGVMFVNFDTSHTFSDVDKERLGTLAEHTTSALKRDQVIRRETEVRQQEHTQEQGILQWLYSLDWHDRIKTRLATVHKVLNTLALALKLEGRDKEALRDVRDTVWDVLGDVRTLIGVANRRLPEDFSAEVSKLIRDTQKLCNAAVTQKLNGNMALIPPQLVWEMLALIGEPLSNAAKYSGARNITLTVEVLAAQVPGETNEESVKIEVRDDGCGWDTQGVEDNGPHFGLINLRTRVERLDGTMECETAPGAGTTITFNLPLKAQP